jgi:hypothetical protein
LKIEEENNEMYNSNIGEKLCFYSATCAFVLILLSLVLGIPVAQVCIGIIYRNDLVCGKDRTETIVDISDWLIAQGSVSILSISLLLTLFYCGKNSIGFYSTICFVYFVNLFSLCWLVIGMIAFWKDCPTLEPSSINTFMWFSLISSIIGFFSNLTASNTMSSFSKEKRPLLG